MIETDVLIIGSGGAGLRAAIETASRGLQTTIVSKGSVNRSGSSPMIGGDLMVDGKSLHDFGLNGNVDDSPQKWFRDMCIEGYYLNNQQLVQNGPHFVLLPPFRLLTHSKAHTHLDDPHS